MPAKHERPEEEGPGPGRVRLTPGVPSARRRGRLPPHRAAGPREPQPGAQRQGEGPRELREQTVPPATARRATPASALGQVSPPPSSQKQGAVGTGEWGPPGPAGSRKPLSSPGHQVNIRRNQAGAGRGGPTALIPSTLFWKEKQNKS